MGCSDHVLDDFMYLRNISLAKSRARTVNFRIFKKLLEEIPEKLRDP